LLGGLISTVLIYLCNEFFPGMMGNQMPLEDGNLKKSIEQVAAFSQFPLKEICIAFVSDSSYHNHVFLIGLWGKKTIVLFNSLFENRGGVTGNRVPDNKTGESCSTEEIVAVVLHEIGHWKLRHTLKKVFLIEFKIFLNIILFTLLFKWTPIYQAIGLSADEKPIVIGFIVITLYVLAPFNTMFIFLMNLLCRKYEYQADDYADQLGFGNNLSQALLKLTKHSLDFPVSDKFYSAWTDSYPTVLQRLEHLKSKKLKKS
jgi:STE24 endopeptidase